MGKNEDGCLLVSENGTRKEFLNVDANNAKDPDGLTGKTLKTCASQLCHIYYIQPILIDFLIPNIWKTSRIIPNPQKGESNNNKRLKTRSSPWPPSICLSSKRNVEDALIAVFVWFPNYSCSHLDMANTYYRILFIAFLSAFNTI